MWLVISAPDRHEWLSLNDGTIAAIVSMDKEKVARYSVRKANRGHSVLRRSMTVRSPSASRSKLGPGLLPREQLAQALPPRVR